MIENKGWEVSKNEPQASGLTIQDLIHFEGMYNPTLRFAFTNVQDNEFVSYWGGKQYRIKPHQSVKLPHHLAVKFTKEIVDRILQEKGKAATMGHPLVREPIENEVLKILPSEDSAEMEVIRQEFIEQIKGDVSAQPGVPVEPIIAPKMDFEDLTPRVSETPIAKKGRPKKE